MLNELRLCCDLGPLENILPLPELDRLILRTEISWLTLEKLLITTDFLSLLDLASSKLEVSQSPIRLPQVKHLDLSSCSLSSFDIGCFLTNQSLLEELNLDFYENFPKLEHEFDLPKLRTLTMQGSTVSFDDLERLLEKSGVLKELSLSRCKKLGSFNAKINFSQLISLNLSQGYISFKDLSALLEAAPLLETLELGRCEFDDEEAVKDICAKRPNLRVKGLKGSYIDNTQVTKDNDDGNGNGNGNPNQDPIHNPKDHKHIPESDPEFVFRGKNKSLNQSMVVEKLSQYLVVYQNC